MILLQWAVTVIIIGNNADAVKEVSKHLTRLAIGNPWYLHSVRMRALKKDSAPTVIII